jgi:hypothetical protein
MIGLQKPIPLLCNNSFTRASGFIQRQKYHDERRTTAEKRAFFCSGPSRRISAMRPAR